MTAENIYQTPEADLATQQPDETYQPRVFATSGRIGRLRYLAYGMAYMMIAYVLMVIGIALGFLSSDPDVNIMVSFVVFGLFGLAALITTFVLMKRRLNDLGKTGWLSLLSLVPFVNIALGLYVLFAPGEQSTNQYGPRPGANSKGLVIGAVLSLAVFFIGGILAAVSIPAYEDYQQRAQQMQ